jgi:hypothetical protein
MRLTVFCLSKHIWQIKFSIFCHIIYLCQKTAFWVKNQWDRCEISTPMLTEHWVKDITSVLRGLDVV